MRRTVPAPLRVERVGDVTHTTLVATAVADEDDVLESVLVEALGDIRQHRLERLLAQADGPGAPHVAARWIDTAFGHVLENWRAQRIPQVPGDPVAVGPEHVVVLPRHQPRAVRLHAAGRDDRGRLSRGERVADVHPRHPLDAYCGRLGERVRRVRTVIHVGAALTAAHRARIGCGALESLPTPAASSARPLRPRRLRRRPTLPDRLFDVPGGFPCTERNDLTTPLDVLHSILERDSVD